MSLIFALSFTTNATRYGSDVMLEVFAIPMHADRNCHNLVGIPDDAILVGREKADAIKPGQGLGFDLKHIDRLNRNVMIFARAIDPYSLTVHATACDDDAQNRHREVHIHLKAVTPT